MDRDKLLARKEKLEARISMIEKGIVDTEDKKLEAVLLKRLENIRTALARVNSRLSE